MGGSIAFRILIVLVAILVVLVGSIEAINHFSPNLQLDTIGILSHFNIDAIIADLIDHEITYVLIALAALNYRGLLRFVRRTIKPTDAQIAGDWYVSRYVKKNNLSEIITERWRIQRDWYSKYNIKTFAFWNGSWTVEGQLVYNERDRFNILLNGTNHKQQSLICFQASIPRDHDTRLLGLGVGDDSQYVLSARVYFASRDRLPDDYIKKVVDEATAQFHASDKSNPLLQLPTEIISNVFEKHRLPEISEESDRKNNRAFGIFASRRASFAKVVAPAGSNIVSIEAK